MKTFVKYAVAAAVTGALAFAAVTPSEARDGRNAAAAVGFGAGALAGAAIASSANGYYGEPGYVYGPGYGYEPSYAYEPAPVYVQPAPTYYYGDSRSTREGNLHGCTSSPASMRSGASC